MPSSTASSMHSPGASRLSTPKPSPRRSTCSTKTVRTQRDDTTNNERRSRMTNYPTKTVIITGASYWGSFSSVFLRCALGLGFLSAVADRLGLWGAFGQPNVEWGNFSRFLEYTHTLNWYLPAGVILPFGGIATGAEIFLGLFLIIGWHTRVAALLSGLLLLTFGVSMTLALGVKAPLNYAVLTGIGGALLLANCESFPFSVDKLLPR